MVAMSAYAIPKFADYGSVWVVLQLTWPQLGLLAAASLFNLVTYWAQLMTSLPGLTLGQAAVNNQAATSIANTIPGGAVLAVGSPMRCCTPGASASRRSLWRRCDRHLNAFLKLAMSIAHGCQKSVAGCQKSVVAATSGCRLTTDYDAPSLLAFVGGGLVRSGRSFTSRCAASLS